MKEVLKNLKRLFVIEEEVAERPAAAPARETGGKAEAVPAQENPVPAPGSLPDSWIFFWKPSRKTTRKALTTWSSGNRCNPLQDMSMEEPTRYQSAYAVAKTLGVSKKPDRRFCQPLFKRFRAGNR
ncbi:MAG: hypothetical protein IPN26_02560 [Bacteroidetes bacterium]|nr:hypothetical protein [Bacteroidota bacterium]